MTDGKNWTELMSHVWGPEKDENNKMNERGWQDNSLGKHPEMDKKGANERDNLSWYGRSAVLALMIALGCAIQFHSYWPFAIGAIIFCALALIEAWKDSK